MFLVHPKYRRKKCLFLQKQNPEKKRMKPYKINQEIYWGFTKSLILGTQINQRSMFFIKRNIVRGLQEILSNDYQCIDQCFNIPLKGEKIFYIRICPCTRFFSYLEYIQISRIGKN